MNEVQTRKDLIDCVLLADYDVALQSIRPTGGDDDAVQRRQMMARRVAFVSDFDLVDV